MSLIDIPNAQPFLITITLPPHLHHRHRPLHHQLQHRHHRSIHLYHQCPHRQHQEVVVMSITATQA
jgi:hypothetical protein